MPDVLQLITHTMTTVYSTRQSIEQIAIESGLFDEGSLVISGLSVFFALWFASNHECWKAKSEQQANPKCPRGNQSIPELFLVFH